MNWIDSVRYALTSLKANAMRSFLTMLGVIIGVAAVVLMVAMGQGAQKQVEQQIESMGGNLILIKNGGRRVSGVKQSGSRQSLTNKDVDAILTQLPIIDKASAFVSTQTQLVAGNLNWNTSIQGIDSSYMAVGNWQIEEGRNITDQELKSASRVAVIGQTIRNELFGYGANVLGEKIRVNNIPVTIIGVLKEKGQSTRGTDQDDIMFMPLDLVKKRIKGITKSKPLSVDAIMVVVTETKNITIAEEKLGSLLRLQHKLSPSASDDFEIRNLAEMMNTRNETTRVFNLLLAGVASVSLFVGGIGIMNTMLVSVTERTREIGLRMAVGATPSAILTQFLMEAIILCLFGGMIGLIIASVTALIGSHLLGWQVLLQWQVVVISWGFSALIGVAFGYFPAKKASKMQPIDALRFE
jgi:putative ABC transport system permease protein